MAHDRLGYARVTADSAKQQTLLNVVRLRYGDHVSFFRVGQVVSGYTLMSEGQRRRRRLHAQLVARATI